MSFKFQNHPSFIHSLFSISTVASAASFFTLIFAVPTFAVTPASQKTGTGKSIASDSTIKSLEIKNDEVFFRTSTAEKSLKKHGEGIRKKKVAIVNVDVYKITLYTTQELLSERSEFKILASPQKAIVMTPLRSFGGDKLKEALIDSYKVNSIDGEQKSHQDFMKLISTAKIQKAEQIIIFGSKDDKSETLYIKRGEQFEAITGHEGFVNEVFAVWLGKTVDKQLESVKQALLGVGK